MTPYKHDCLISAPYWKPLGWTPRESGWGGAPVRPGCYDSLSPQGGSAPTGTAAPCTAGISEDPSLCLQRAPETRLENGGLVRWHQEILPWITESVITAITESVGEWITESQRAFLGGKARATCTSSSLPISLAQGILLQENANQEQRWEPRGSDLECWKARMANMLA